MLKRRWALIEHHSINLLGVAETKIDYDDDWVWVRQRKINKASINDIPMSARGGLIVEFANELDFLSNSGFVHGDITRKNIIYDGKRLHLVDLEPDLIQIKSGRRIFLATKPYIAATDLRTGTLTEATDKLSFACFCKIWGKGEPRPLDANKLLSERRARDIPIMPNLPDSMVVGQSFFSITRLCNLN